MTDPRWLSERFEAVCARLRNAAERSGRAAAEIRLVAVSKRHAAESVVALARHWAAQGGQPAFGENYAQEAAAKRVRAAQLAPELDLEWHFIGHIQTNKAKDLAGRCRLIHSLDSVKLGLALSRAWRAGVLSAPRLPYAGPPPPQAVLLQVNIGREAQKAGIFPEDLESTLPQLTALPELDIQGLMCLPPDLEHPEAARPYFRRLRELRDALRTRAGLALPHLSMGMSHDFEAAVEEGATLVRVGIDIFGARE